MQTAHAESWFSLEPDIMEVEGGLDANSAPRLEEDVCLCIQSGARRMILDCRALSYISGAGLRAILVMALAMQKACGRFAVCDLQPQVREMFETSGFNFFIPAFDDCNEAMTAFGS